MKRFNPLKPQTPASVPITKPRKAPQRSPGATEFTTTLTENARGDGLELRFPDVPPDDTLKALHAHKWWWSRRRMAWIHKNTPENREFAQRFLNPPAPANPTATVDGTGVAEQPNVIPVQFTPEKTEPCNIQPAATPIWRARLLSR